MAAIHKILLALTLVSLSSAKKVSVSTSKELQEALDKASPGDVIGLTATTFSGSFVASKSGEQGKPITLVADDLKDKEKCKIVGDGKGAAALTVKGSFMDLKYFAISNKGGLAVLLEGGDNNVESLAILNSDKAMEVKGPRTLVKDCSVTETKKGIFIEASHVTLDANALMGAEPSIFAGKDTCCGTLNANAADGKVDIQGKDYKQDLNVMKG